MISSALGILKWPPDVFWRSTVYEYTAAMRGHFAASGVDTEGGMTRNQYLTLVAKDKQAKAG